MKMARRRALQRAGRALLLWTAPVLLWATAALAGCGGSSSSTLILVSISGVPDGTETLRATSYLDGRPEQDPADLAGTERQLVVRLAPGATGLYRLEIDALGDDGCSFAQGQAEVTVGEMRRIEMPIALGSSGLTSCILAVRKTGLGQGYISSDPLGISCGTREGASVQECAFRFQKGVPVHLVAQPSPAASFDGWTESCTGPIATCDVIMTGPRTVTAAFGVRIQ